MSTNQKVLIVLSCLAIVGVTFYSQKYQKEKKSMIDNYKYLTIAKVFEIKPEKSFTVAVFYYYYNGLKYESTEHIDGSGSRYINKYFKVELATVKPEYSQILFDEEVTDSTEIVRAGLKYERPPEE